MASLFLTGAASGTQCVFVSGPNGTCLAVRVLPDYASLRVGSTLQLRVDGGGACALGHGSRWQSTRPDVASVDSTGLVHALNPGWAEIRTRSEVMGDGNAAEGTAAMRVEVGR